PAGGLVDGQIVVRNRAAARRRCRGRGLVGDLSARGREGAAPAVQEKAARQVEISRTGKADLRAYGRSAVHHRDVAVVPVRAVDVDPARVDQHAGRAVVAVAGVDRDAAVHGEGAVVHQHAFGAVDIGGGIDRYSAGADRERARAGEER